MLYFQFKNGFYIHMEVNYQIIFSVSDGTADVVDVVYVNM